MGAGIGGIAAGIALLDAGFQVTVFEKSEELREAGAGMSLWPNGTGVLQELGLLDRVMQHGALGTNFLLRNTSGELLMNIRTAEADTPTVCVHRADLLRALTDAFPHECLKLDHAVEELSFTGAKARLKFSNGEEFVCDGVIGADGIHSRIRSSLPGARKPAYQGYAIVRAVADAPSGLPSGHNEETWGAGNRFGVLAIGRNKVCWYATANTSGPRQLARDCKDRWLETFSGWHGFIPDLIAQTDPAAILVSDACDLVPFRSHSPQPVTLLGDASHALTPNLGQGACLALEDSFVLAGCLRQYSNITEAFRRYESLRFSHLLSAVLRSRWLGYVGQWESRAAVALRNAITRILPASNFECHIPFAEYMARLTRVTA